MCRFLGFAQGIANPKNDWYRLEASWGLFSPPPPSPNLKSSLRLWLQYLAAWGQLSCIDFHEGCLAYSRCPRYQVIWSHHKNSCIKYCVLPLVWWWLDITLLGIQKHPAGAVACVQQDFCLHGAGRCLCARTRQGRAFFPSLLQLCF